jgi:uncharacterized membrane protein YgcG
MVAPLLLAGCEVARAPANEQSAGARAQGQGGRIVDLADALSAAEEQALDRRLAGREKADGSRVMVVVIEPGKQQSLEQVGWAVGGGSAAKRPLLMLVDPASRRVRIEGDLGPERRAEVASAMQPGLAGGRVAEAIERGLSRLEVAVQ